MLSKIIYFFRTHLIGIFIFSVFSSIVAAWIWSILVNTDTQAIIKPGTYQLNVRFIQETLHLKCRVFQLSSKASKLECISKFHGVNGLIDKYSASIRNSNSVQMINEFKLDSNDSGIKRQVSQLDFNNIAINKISGVWTFYNNSQIPFDLIRISNDL